RVSSFFDDLQFFISSRRRHTRFKCDWSSDVCSSDLREMTPWFEEHVKMFAPLGFVPGITEGQIRAAATRGGWAAAGVPSLEDFTRSGAWYCGAPEGFVASLKDLEQRYPGLEHVNVSSSMGTPTAVCLEQLARFAQEVLPHFPGAKGDRSDLL